jgi:hypothetical protein
LKGKRGFNRRESWETEERITIKGKIVSKSKKGRTFLRQKGQGENYS